MVDEVKPGGPPLSRPRWQFNRRQVVAQVAVAAVILISGIAIGTGGTILALKDRIRFRPQIPPDRYGDRLVERWQTDLSLNDAQAQQIKDLLTKRSDAGRKRWEEIWKAEQTERAAFVKSMKGILTPGQYEKWTEELKEREKHWQNRWPGGPDGRRGPEGFRGRGGPDGGRGGPDGFRERRGPDGERSGGPRGEWRPGGPPGPPPEGAPEFRPPDPVPDSEPNASPLPPAE